MDHHLRRDAAGADVVFGRAWREHRRYVLDIAFRMVGRLGDAEDVVQEAFSRLLHVDIDEIDEVRGWLVVVVSRLCLDRLRFDRRHRAAAGPPELALVPGARQLDPADQVTLDESVRLALHVVLARLTPAERTTFVLHDVFKFTFDEVADIVGRTPAACRKLASRARRTIRADAGDGRFTVESTEQRRAMDQFAAACTTGDLDGLLAVLDPDVSGVVDLGGAIGRRPPVEGRDRVATTTLRFYGPDSSTTLLSLPLAGGAGIVAVRDGSVFALITLRVHGDVIGHLHGVIDPIRVAPLNRVIGF
jgi:RNA polymerase sigma-70 factor (ECF subfamily)